MNTGLSIFRLPISFISIGTNAFLYCQNLRRFINSNAIKMKSLNMKLFPDRNIILEIPQSIHVDYKGRV